MPNRFEELRVRKGFSQEGIAKSAGMNQVQWSRWEKPPDALEHLAKLLQSIMSTLSGCLGCPMTSCGHPQADWCCTKESGIYTATSAPLPDGGRSHQHRRPPQ